MDLCREAVRLEVLLYRDRDGQEAVGPLVGAVGVAQSRCD